MITDLGELGIFDPPKGRMETRQTDHETETKKAG